MHAKSHLPLAGLGRPKGGGNPRPGPGLAPRPVKRDLLSDSGDILRAPPVLSGNVQDATKRVVDVVGVMTIGR